MRLLLPPAVTLANQIERFGSYFGIAALIGLGLLALLYFTQAREVKRLREWAGRAPERDVELAQRVQAGAQRRVVAQPVPVPAQPGGPQTAAAQQADAARKAAAAAVMQKAPPGTGAAPAAKPAGQLARPAPSAGAPGTVPTPGTPPATAGAATGGASAGQAGAPEPAASAGGTSTGAPAPGGAPAGAGAAGATSVSGPAGASAGTPGTPPASNAGAKDVVSGPVTGRRPPATGGAATAAAAAAAAARQAGAPARSPAFDNGGGGQDTHESQAARPAPLPELPRRPSRTASTAPPPAGDGDGRGRGRGRRRVVLVIAVVVAALAIAAAAVLLLAPANEPTTDNSIGGGAVPAGSSAASSGKLDRKDTRVAVLNGTTQTGLARGVGNKLQDRGFTILSVGDNADQQIATTTVFYAAGNEPAARAVSRIVGVASTAVKPIDTNTATAVAPEANVVVTVGNDRSSAG